jgi:glycosyltransferase involved in cell wall biosynthesis
MKSDFPIHKVSCVIPAYNEGPRIEKVLEAVHKHPLVGEIIVVDDCSRDNTKDVVKEFEGITLMMHETNKGKSCAVAAGVAASSGDLLLFLDSDLVGLKGQNITDLIDPVISGRADVSISLRRNAPWLYRKIGLDFISGERVFPKHLIEGHLDEIGRLHCFCLESYMNKLLIENGYRIKVVSWPNVESPWPTVKRGWWKGLKERFSNTFDVVKSNWLFGVFYQINRMSALKVE